ncbi:uncharacterized protein LOC128619928 isoform X2 [Ictalurus furcatus]|uniref:uncharacterized protein LOC128619928 isoform X2 n=1 Tax=Ictalurus furcatus TaxID=66913 RepID=UPI00234FBEE2|nr:uncharacterized protein LOC128619928 isoform X2 [Ictalurus furcatus]XP_053500425.1 uncharacterized protein LOC128619928 isoform X2 [Ictalurus furcatus]XP_053500426.1 uncharacterized protein LOC128619928 isoform X2 [Ictalurus furcatus]
MKNLDTLLHCVCNKQIKMEKKWGSNRSVDLKRMCPQQKARYLAYAEPSKEIQAWMAACHKRIHSRLAHEREKAWGKNPLQDLDSKLHQDTLIGQLKAAEARNRIRQMTLHCHNLKAIKQMAHHISCSMGSLVAAERHLWLNLSGMGDKDKVSLLDTPVKLSSLFSGAVNAMQEVLDRFRKAKQKTAAFSQFFPRLVKFIQASMSGAQANTSAREAQKMSVVAHLPPRRARETRWPQSQPSSKPDLRMIINAKQTKKRS